MGRFNKGYFKAYRCHILNSGENPAFLNKPKNKFVYMIIKAMANFKKTDSLPEGHLFTSYAEISKETGYTYGQVRWAVDSLINHKMLGKNERQAGLHLIILDIQDSTADTTDQTTVEQQQEQQTDDAKFISILNNLSNVLGIPTTDLHALLLGGMLQTNNTVIRDLRSKISYDPAQDHAPSDSEKNSKKKKNLKEEKINQSNQNQLNSVPTYDRQKSVVHDDGFDDDGSFFENLNMFDKESILNKYSTELSQIVKINTKRQAEKLESLVNEKGFEDKNIGDQLSIFKEKLAEGAKIEHRAAYFIKMIQNTPKVEKSTDSLDFDPNEIYRDFHGYFFKQAHKPYLDHICFDTKTSTWIKRSDYFALEKKELDEREANGEDVSGERWFFELAYNEDYEKIKHKTKPADELSRKMYNL